MSDDTLTIEIDGRTLPARKGQMLIEVADANAIPIPRFCYHEKLSVAANCRMCLVEVERAPKPLPACATPVMDGMKVFTRSKIARNAQKSVMEFLLINHPLDCPICDQGGECELQDVAMGYGRDVSQFNERKRAVEDKDLGPLIATDMTRCIHCTRCVRFGEEIGGMPELGATGRGEDMEIGTFITRSVDSELSGNVIDLCPVGALTSKPFRFRARAWEMAQHDGIAPHDPIGSNIHLHVRRGRVLRVVPRANESINEAWISDRDRFGYEGLYSEDRVRAPMVKRDGTWSEVSWEEALEAVVAELREVVAGKGAEAVGALASASCTLEELYLFQRLVRGIGCANVDHRLRQRDFSDQDAAPAYPSLGMGVEDLERLGATLLIGSWTRKEHPIVNHRLRKASLAGASVMHLDVMAHDLNLPLAARVVVAPSKLAERLAAVTAAAARRVDRWPEGLEALTEGVEIGDDAERMARTLIEADRGAILLGPQAINHRDAAALRGLAACLADLTGATLGTLDEGANPAGAWIAGAVPHREVNGVPSSRIGLDARAMIEAGLDAYVLMGLEPELDGADGARDALTAAGFVVSLSTFRSEAMSEYADAILPVAAFAETEGTFVNLAGTWQSFGAAAPSWADSRPAWRVLRVLGNLFEVDGFDQETIEDVQAALGTSDSAAASRWSLPAHLPESEGVGAGLERIALVPIYATDALVRRSTPLQATKDGEFTGVGVSPATLERLGLGDGESVVVRQGVSSLDFRILADRRVPADCALLPAGIPATASLGGRDAPITLERRCGGG
ncbi:MAG: NADH-quinone oxidoreductase subunit NuoG [Thiotrichales bacterium]|nr:NADH-quinone oxidoreductase subunit NuoG [Thiotrichales bacterium]